MKCDNCKYRKFKPAGSWLSVAEGNDDPYSYEYCARYHWIGADEMFNPENIKDKDDPFKNCIDFIEK